VVRHFLCWLFLLGITACSQSAPPPPPVAPPPVALDANALCLQDLTRMGVAFQSVQPFTQPNNSGCGIDNPVKVTATLIPWNRPAVLSCDLARTMVKFEQDVVLPLAQRQFGQGISQFQHAGTYDCRVQRNNSTNGGTKAGRLSEHAKGLAIDISGYKLADGTMLSVKGDWRGQGKKSLFLREMARSACSTFHVVLSPNYDKYHQDHVHVDLGQYSLCGS